MSIPNQEDSSGNHSIVSIQSIRSVTPRSRPIQISIQDSQQIYNQLQHQLYQLQPSLITTTHHQLPSRQAQTPSIFNYHQALTPHTQITHNNTNNHFPIMNFTDNNTNTNNNNNNTITTIPSLPCIPTLPPINLPLPLPPLSNNPSVTHTTNNINRTSTHQSVPIKLRQNNTNLSNIDNHHHTAVNTHQKTANQRMILSRKRKRKRKRKKRRNGHQDMYYYQLERACGLEIEEPAYITDETAMQINDDHDMECSHNQAPSPRFAHCSCIHGDYFYVWGGRNQTRTFYPVDNELYTYHLPSKKWTKIKPKLNVLYNSRDTYNGSNPQPRYKPFAVTGATAIVYRSCIYIFGGYHTRYTNQLLKYDIDNNYWCVIDARGDIPQRRWEYSACVYQKKMYIFGGTLDRTHFNDLYSFDFESSTWTELQPVNSSNSPRPRRRHKAVVYKHKMYIFGGREEPPIIRDQLPQDLQIYSFRDRTWSRISCADSSSSISIPIALNHSLYVHKSAGLLYVFGCQDAPVVTYDFKLNRWYPVSSRNYERHGLSLCTTHHGNVGYWKHSLYIFGGQSRDKVVQGNLLKFSLNPQPQYTKDMLSMLNNACVSDIQFRITNDDNAIVYAHKFMLMSRCEYFKKMFSGGFLEAKQRDTGNPLVINIENCSKKVFLAVLRYFYTDELWQPCNVNDTLEMLSLADLYQFKIMRSHCCKILENLLSISNAILLLQASRKFNLINFKNIIKDFIMANFYIYQNTLGLMTDLIELIQLHAMNNKCNKDNDKEEVNDDNAEKEQEVNEWKALHNEIMDAMGKLFVNNSHKNNNNILTLTQRQKRLKVKLTQKDIDEYRKTHKEMVYQAKYGKSFKKMVKKDAPSLDDDDNDEKDVDSQDNSSSYSDDDEDEDEDDDDDSSEYSDHEYNNANNNDTEIDTPRPSKRRRLNNNNNNNNNNNIFNMHVNDNENNQNDNNPPVHSNNNNNNNNNNLLLNTNTNTPNFVDESMDREHLPYLVADVNHRNHN